MGFSWSNNFLHLLNTESLLLLLLQKQLNHDHNHNAQSEISITHNTEVLPGKRKAKNPTIIYYVYHESWNNLVQNSNPRDLSTIQSSHTVIHKLANTCANSCVQTACLLCTNSAIWILTIILASFAHAHKHIHCMCEQITTDSQIVPFTCYLNWCPLELTCM